VNRGVAHILGKSILLGRNHVLRLVVHYIGILDHLKWVKALLCGPHLVLVAINWLDYLVHYLLLRLLVIAWLKLKSLGLSHLVLKILNIRRALP
jgi:hypothetical protein